jgi:hypothetical protein
MTSFYVIVNPFEPDIIAVTYTEVINYLFDDKTRKAYLYVKASDGLMKPINMIKLVDNIPIHTILSVFDCPTEYLTYPITANICKCGWSCMQGSSCMRCSWKNDYYCLDCGVNNLEYTCKQICPNISADF